MLTVSPVTGSLRRIQARDDLRSHPSPENRLKETTAVSVKALYGNMALQHLIQRNQLLEIPLLLVLFVAVRLDVKRVDLLRDLQRTAFPGDFRVEIVERGKAVEEQEA